MSYTYKLPMKYIHLDTRSKRILYTSSGRLEDCLCCEEVEDGDLGIFTLRLCLLFLQGTEIGTII